MTGDDDRPNDDEIRAAQRVTTEEARMRAGAAEGVIEPAASEEADEPTTAAADRIRMGREADPSPASPS